MCRYPTLLLTFAKWWHAYLKLQFGIVVGIGWFWPGFACLSAEVAQGLRKQQDPVLTCISYIGMFCLHQILNWPWCHEESFSSFRTQWKKRSSLENSMLKVQQMCWGVALGFLGLRCKSLVLTKYRLILLGNGLSRGKLPFTGERSSLFPLPLRRIFQFFPSKYEFTVLSTKKSSVSSMVGHFWPAEEAVSGDKCLQVKAK